MDDTRSESLDLARWQGQVDEKLSDSKRRLDNINGDIKDIKEMVGQMRDENREFQVAALDRRRKDRIALVAAITPLITGLIGAVAILLAGGGIS